MTVETTRVGAGRSPRLGAIAVVGILVAVAWVGFSNRPPTPRPTPSSAVAVASSPSPSPPPMVGATPFPTATSLGSTPPPPAAGPPSAGGAASGTRDYYIVQAAFNSRTLTTLVTETAPGRLVAELTIPIDLLADTGELRFLGLQQSAPDTPVDIGRWHINLGSLDTTSGGELLVLDRRVGARPRPLNQPLPVLRGYRLTATAQGDLATSRLTIVIRIGLRGRIIGDDGIFGWPTVAQLPTITGLPRERGAFNYCRWDVGVLAARPKFGHDESDCA